MPQFKFGLDEIKELDGGLLVELFRVKQEAIVKDCLERPGDSGKRKLTITFHYVPSSERGGNSVCDDVAMFVKIKSSVPDEMTRAYILSPRQNGQLVAHTDFPDDPEAKGLYDGETPERKSE